MAPTKKQKEKAADFQKTKLKLGKGKLVSQNATNTKIAAKSITLPSQSLDVDNTGIPTTKRNHTYEDVLAQVNHYSVSVKKGRLSLLYGLAGLKELFSAYPSLMLASVGSTLKTCVPLMTHAEAPARKALISFLDWYLPQLDDAAAPFHALLVFHTTSALTHIHAEVRADGVKILDLLLASFPQTVTAGWNVSLGGMSNHGYRLLECYLALLHVKGTAQGAAAAGSSAQLSPALRALSLRSLATFLKSALGDTTAAGHANSWFFSSAFTNERHFQLFLQRRGYYQPSSIQAIKLPNNVTKSFHTDSLPKATFSSSLVDLEASLTDLAPEVSSYNATQSETSTPARLLRILLPTLLAAFLDSAPTALGPGSTPNTTDIHIQTVQSVMETTLALLRAIATQSPSSEPDPLPLKDISRLLKAMHTYFPFEKTVPSIANNATRELLLGLSLGYCEIASLAQIAGRVNRKGKMTESDMMRTIQDKVAEYAIELLQPAENNDLLQSQRFSADSFMALQPTLWTLIESRAAETASSVFQAVLGYYSRLPASSELKLLVLRFITDCIFAQQQSGYSAAFTLSALNSECQATFQTWLTGLPRSVWEAAIARKNPELVAAILPFLQICASSLPISELIHSDQMTLALDKLLSTEAPKTGKLLSPFSQMTSEQRQMTISLVEYISSRATVEQEQNLSRSLQAGQTLIKV